MELIRNTVKTENKFFSGMLRTIVENDAIVSQTKPDIGKILQVDARSFIISSEVKTDRVVVNGKVEFHILYLPEKGNGCIKSMTCTAEFSDVKDVSGADENMISVASCETENVSFRVINGRKLNVKAEILTKISVYHFAENDVVCGVEEGHMELKSSDISYISYDRTVNRKFSVTDIVAIPVSQPLAEDVIKVDVKVSEFNTKPINNKVIIKGSLVASMVYVTSGKQDLNVFASEIPFTEVIEADGIEENSKSIISLSPLWTEYDIKGDDAGDINAVNLKTEINAKVRVIKEEKANVINDGYSLEGKTELTKKTIEISTVADNISKQITLKEVIYAESDAPEISKIYNVECDVYPEEITADETGISISANADVYVLYVSEDEEIPVNNLHKEFKINEKIKCSNTTPDSVCDIDLSTISVSYNIVNESSVEVRMNIGAEGVVYNKQIISPVTDVLITEENEKKPSLTVYFPDEGEELWTVAKRYQTSVDAIKSMNDLADDKIKKGMRLLIPKTKKLR